MPELFCFEGAIKAGDTFKVNHYLSLIVQPIKRKRKLNQTASIQKKEVSLMNRTKVQSELPFWSSTLGDNLILHKLSMKKESFPKPVCEPNVITDAAVLQSASSIKSNIYDSSGSQSVSSFFFPKKECSSSSSTLTSFSSSSALSRTSFGLKRNLSMSQASTSYKVPITETNGNNFRHGIT